MSQLVGTLHAQNGNFQIPVEVRHKEDQNVFKGIAWQAAGTTLCFVALATTSLAAGFIIQAGLVGTGILTEGLFYTPHTFVEGGALIGAAVIGDLAFVKGVAACFTNAIYHLGSETELVYPPIGEEHYVCPLDQLI